MRDDAKCGRFSLSLFPSRFSLRESLHKIRANASRALLTLSPFIGVMGLAAPFFRDAQSFARVLPRRFPPNARAIVATGGMKEDAEMVRRRWYCDFLWDVSEELECIEIARECGARYWET